MNSEDWACLLFAFVLAPCTVTFFCCFLAPIPSWVAIPCFIVTVVGWMLVVAFLPEIDSQNTMENKQK